MSWVGSNTGSVSQHISTPQTTGGSGGGIGMGMIASGVISGIGSIAQGFINAKMMKDTYNFNAQMSEIEGRMLGLQGRMAKISADVAIKGIRKRANTLYATQRAMYANAGVKMGGSPAAVMLNSLKESELDVIYTQINSDYQIGGIEYQAGTKQTQAGIYRGQGKMEKYNAYQNMNKSILKIGQNWMERA